MRVKKFASVELLDDRGTPKARVNIIDYESGRIKGYLKPVKYYRREK